MHSTIKPTLKETKPMTVAFIKTKGHFSQIPAAFGRLYNWITEKGYKPHGPAIVVYYNIPGQVPDDELQWELRSQISEHVTESSPNREGLGVKRLGTAYVAAVTHEGPYEKLEETYQLLTLWVDNNEYEANGPPEELYFNSPEQVPPSELRTEIRFPVRKK